MMNTPNDDSNFGFIKALLFVATVLLFATGTMMAQKVWTLEDCVNHALEHNIRIKQSKLEVEAARISDLQSKLDVLPSLNGSASNSYGWGRSIDMATYQYVDKQTQSSYFNLNSDVTLFSGFQKLNTMKQKRADYLIAKYNSDKMRNDISLTVASYYLQILFSRELYNKALAQVEITKQQEDRTSKLVEAGVLAQGNLLTIQAQRASEEVSVIQAENQLTLAYLDLLQLLELEAGTPIEIDAPQLKVSNKPELLPVQMVYNKALEVMPEIKSAQMNYTKSSNSLAIARGSRSPSVSMSASLGTNYSDQIRVSNNPLDPAYNQIKPFETQWNDNRSTTLSLRLAIPIFNGHQISSYIGKAKLSLLNADYNLELAKNTLRKSVESAYADAFAAHSTYVAREKSLVSLKESLNYTEQRFSVGMVNATDFNVAKNQMNRAESDLVSAKYDYIFKLKILDFYLGRALTLKDMKAFMEN